MKNLGQKVTLKSHGDKIGRIWMTNGNDETCKVRFEDESGKIESITGWIPISQVTVVK